MQSGLVTAGLLMLPAFAEAAVVHAGERGATPAATNIVAAVVPEPNGASLPLFALAAVLFGL